MTELTDIPVQRKVVTEAEDAFQPKNKPPRQKWLKCPTRAEDIRALCHPDGRKHMLYGAIPHFGVYFAAIAGQLLIDNLLVNVLLSVVIGWQLYNLFVLHHDCMHGSAFRNDALNRLMGRIYAMTFTMTFSVNRQTHMRHHAHITDPERDPDEYYFSGKLHQIWMRIWRYYEWYTRIALTRYGKKVRNTVVVEQLFNIAIWVLIHIALFAAGMEIKALFIFWLPLLVVAGVINPITRGYEHSPITLYEKDDPRRLDMSANAITCSSAWYGWMCANISYHVEHHAFPRCPFYNLRKLHLILQEEKVDYLVAPYPLYKIWKGKAMLDYLRPHGTAASQTA